MGGREVGYGSSPQLLPSPRKRRNREFGSNNHTHFPWPLNLSTLTKYINIIKNKIKIKENQKSVETLLFLQVAINEQVLHIFYFALVFLCPQVFQFYSIYLDLILGNFPGELSAPSGNLYLIYPLTYLLSVSMMYFKRYSALSYYQCKFFFTWGNSGISKQ